MKKLLLLGIMSIILVAGCTQIPDWPSPEIQYACPQLHRVDEINLDACIGIDDFRDVFSPVTDESLMPPVGKGCIAISDPTYFCNETLCAKVSDGYCELLKYCPKGYHWDENYTQTECD